ncbi:glycosyltransferase family 4 protein, partial [Patescibacteria group bacterium]|nr:glycosyltransferase family 4 protein [Patescibacteria group bacterium]
MKKTLLVTLEFPPQKGGIATYLYQLIKNLPPELISVLVPPCSDSEQFDHNHPFKTIRANLLSNNPILWPKWITAYLKVRELVKKSDYQHIIVSHLLPIGTVAYFIKKKLGIPYTVIVHGLDVLTAQSSWRKKITMLRVLSSADIIIANSQYTAGLLTELGDYSNKVKVITPGCNPLLQFPGEDVEALRNKLGLADKRVILTVGRLVKRKGHDQVIKAITQLIGKFPKLVYLIVGQGSYQQELQEMVSQYQLNNQVKFVGAVSDQQLPVFYQTAEIFINVERKIGSDVPGFGIVFLEANSLSLPVIGGRAGGVAEAIVENQTGLLVDPQDIKEIAAAIDQLL